MSDINYKQAIAVLHYREQCGLSQAGLAIKLKTTRSHISMVERGLRNLPPHALEILEKLIHETNNAAISTDKDFDPLELSPEDLMVFRKELAERSSEALYRRLLLKKKLRAMIESYPAMLKIYNLLAQQSMKTAGTEEVSGSYLLHLNKWKKKLEHSNRLSQLTLQLKTDLLLAEATVITKFLESC